MATAFFYSIVVILVLDYCAERWLEFLNMTRMSETLPDELADIYDPDRYKKSQQYLRTRQKFSFLRESLSFVAVMAVLAAGLLPWLDGLLRGVTENPVWLALLFFGILGLAASVLAIPFELYAVFVIEERFGFNTMTPATFFLDKLKGLLLSAIIGGPLLALIVWIYTWAGNYFWIVVWAVVSFFMIFMSMFYSNLIVPLFNKQKPLEAGQLRDAIEAFSNKVGFRLKNIYVIDGSKRSKKANAYFTGLGGKKRIVLYDTLINDHTVEELVAVLAHEIGHYKKKHTTQGIVLSVLQTGLMLFILSFFIRQGSLVSQDLCQSLAGFSGRVAVQGFHLGVLAFGMLYTPLSTLLGLADNVLSRHNEYQADHFAGVNFNPGSLQDALRKLSVNNLSNLRPHPAYVFVYYSHPTLLQRLEALNKLK